MAVWAIWVGLGLSTLLSFVSLFLFTHMLRSYCRNKSSSQDVLLASWLTVSLTSFTAAASYSCYSLFWLNDCLQALYVSGFYVSLFIATAILLYKPVITWWDSLWFLHYEFARTPLPLPPSQLAFLTPQRPLVRTPPKTLVQVSSTYFQAADEACCGEEQIVDDPQCKLCYSQDSDAVLMDCGHGGLCFECAVQIFRRQGQCCFCRSQVSQVLKVKAESNARCSVVSSLSV